MRVVQLNFPLKSVLCQSNIHAMKRRQFLKASSASCLAITTLDLISCQSNSSSIKPDENAQAFALEEVTIDELQQKMASGELYIAFDNGDVSPTN